MKIKDIMTKDPICCTSDTNLYTVARLMVEHDCGAIPVIKSPETRIPVGIITDRDITCRAVARGENPQRMIAGDCMSHPVLTIDQEASLEDCYRAMEHNKVRRMLVVDEHDDCCGIVSVADMAMWGPNPETSELIRALSQPPRTASRYTSAL